MTEDFLDAHNRHWQDAELLYGNERLANADHLYGISAECGLKALIEKLNNGNLAGRDRRHIMEPNKPDNAWDRYHSYLDGSTAQFMLLPAGNPFQDWDIAQRYANQDQFVEPRISTHRSGAQQIQNLINQAELQGFL